ncbi:MAG: hypothetical protein AAF961_03490 [Planctomycetota bacterium]
MVPEHRLVQIVVSQFVPMNDRLAKKLFVMSYVLIKPIGRDDAAGETQEKSVQ